MEPTGNIDPANNEQWIAMQQAEPPYRWVEDGSQCRTRLCRVIETDFGASGCAGRQR